MTWKPQWTDEQLDDDRLFERRLREHEAAWQSGDARALSDAIDLCEFHKTRLPQWVREGVRAFTEDKRDKPTRQDDVHFARWDVVREIRDRQEELDAQGYNTKWTDGAVYETASKALRGSTAQGSKDAIRRSYKLVQKALKDGQFQRFWR